MEIQMIWRVSSLLHSTIVFYWFESTTTVVCECCTQWQVCADALFGVFCMCCLAAEWRKHLSSQTVGWHCLKAGSHVSPLKTLRWWISFATALVPWSPPPDTHSLHGCCWEGKLKNRLSRRAKSLLLQETNNKSSLHTAHGWSDAKVLSRSR